MPEERKLLGTAFHGCKIVRWLGGGGMGDVYLAKHLALERDVAIKFLNRETAADVTGTSRFLREARTLAQLDAPNVVAVYDCGMEDGRHFIILQFIQGCNLEDHVRRKGGQLQPAEAVSIVRQCLEGLRSSHELGVIHRDIKPANILISEKGVVKLTDFGLVKNFKADQLNLTRGQGAVGTPLYMSPEQWSGGELDQRTDLYSLGVTFYYLLAGTVPYMAQDVYELRDKVLAGDRQPLEAFARGIDRNLAGIVDKMMSRGVEQRFPNAATVLAALSRTTHERGVERTAPAGPRAEPRPGPPLRGATTALPPSPPPPRRPPTRRAAAEARIPPRSAAPVIGLAVAILIGMGGLVALMMKGGAGPAPKGSEPPPPSSGAAPAAAPSGKIRLTLRPKGAQVSIDGRPQGRADAGTLQLERVAPGKRMIRCSLEGFKDEEKECVVAADRIATLEIRLNAVGMTFIPAGRLKRGLTPQEAQMVASGSFSDPGLASQARERLLGYAPSEVEVPAFYIDTTEVSSEDYAKFIEATGRKAPSHWVGGRCPNGVERHPAVNVSWEDARAYAQWAGKRLLREVEWERAVRGDHGYYYPWGNRFEKDRCSTSEGPHQGTLPVDAFENGRSPFGVYNLVGNVWEWIEDSSDSSKAMRLLKGSSFGGFGSLYGIFCDRMPGAPDVTRVDIGFRCARDAD